MANADVMRTTLCSQGSATVQQRPSLLLMKLTMKAAKSTLELGLTKLKKQCESTANWLKSLGAVDVDIGEPHFADQAKKDPLQAAQAAAMSRLSRSASGAGSDSKRSVIRVLTAFWNIASLSAEEILVLVDRLRFEMTEESEDQPEESTSWASPEEQMAEMMTRLHKPPMEDGAPQFVFIARLSEEQTDEACARAFQCARASAERSARAAQMRLGQLSMLNFVTGPNAGIRPSRLMERQRSETLLVGSSYELRDDEIASDDPLPAEFTISVHANFYLEPKANRRRSRNANSGR